MATPSFADFDRRANAGERLTIAFLGGSLTWGANASDPQRTSYRALVGDRFVQIYPNAHFKFVDAAIGGTGAQLGVFRLDRDVLRYKPDLLFLDFTVNDGIYSTSPDTLAAHEAIVRRTIGEAHCPVIQMIIAVREHITHSTTADMERRAAHLAIGGAYNVPVGDVVQQMREAYSRGEMDLNTLWPPERFDDVHPADAGYAVYADVAWRCFQGAVSNHTGCTLPKAMLHPETYLHANRVRLSSLKPLPGGWRVALPNVTSIAFDFLMTRWLDDVCVGSNFVQKSHDWREPAEPFAPLRLRFDGSSVLLFGEMSEYSCRYRVLIDGRPALSHGDGLPAGEFDASHNGNGRLVQVIAEGLNVDTTHALEIVPLLHSTWKPQELRIESICVAGGNARMWLEPA